MWNGFAFQGKDRHKTGVSESGLAGPSVSEPIVQVEADLDSGATPSKPLQQLLGLTRRLGLWKWPLPSTLRVWTESFPQNP